MRCSGRDISWWWDGFFLNFLSLSHRFLSRLLIAHSGSLSLRQRGMRAIFMTVPPDAGYTLLRSVARYRLESVLYTHDSCYSLNDVYTGRRKFPVPRTADDSFDVSVLRCKLMTSGLAEAPTRDGSEFQWKSAGVSIVFVQEHADSIVPKVKLSDTCQVDFTNQVSAPFSALQVCRWWPLGPTRLRSISLFLQREMNIAFVGNTGHFGNEIDLAGSEGLEGRESVILPHWSQRDRAGSRPTAEFVSKWRLAPPCTWCTAHCLCPGRCRLHCCHASGPFQAYKNDLRALPKELDEIVVTLHLPALGAALTVFAQGHAVCSVVKVESLFRPTRQGLPPVATAR